MSRMQYGGSSCDMETKEDLGNLREDTLDPEMSAFIGRLYQENYSKLLSHILKKGYHFAVAEDIVHDAYFEAVRNPDKLREHPNPGGWLMTTVDNKLRSFNRRLKRMEPRDWTEWETSLIDLEDEYGATELTLLLDTLLNPKDRRLFRMYFLQGYSARELAEQEHITVNNLKVKMCRMRAKLEKEIRKDI